MERAATDSQRASRFPSGDAGVFRAAVPPILPLQPPTARHYPQGAAGVLTPLAHAIEHTTDSVIITDRDGIIEYVNPRFLEITGFAREECIGRKTSLVRSGAHTPRFYDRLWRTILSGRRSTRS
jgi:PAS domain-containing protein